MKSKDTGVYLISHSALIDLSDATVFTIAGGETEQSSSIS
jgi:hypothetical protein